MIHKHRNMHENTMSYIFDTYTDPTRNPAIITACDSGMVPRKPVLVVVIDGGPDHRITYASV